MDKQCAVFTYAHVGEVNKMGGARKKVGVACLWSITWCGVCLIPYMYDGGVSCCSAVGSEQLVLRDSPRIHHRLRERHLLERRGTVQASFTLLVACSVNIYVYSRIYLPFLRSYVSVVFLNEQVHIRQHPLCEGPQ